MAVTLTGLDTVLKNLNKEIAGIRNRSLKGLIRAQIVVRRDMDKTPPKIPVDTGNLRSSYFTVTSKGTTEAGDSPKFSGEEVSKLQAGHAAVMNEQQGSIVGKLDPTLIMGFTAYYAMYVHEMVEAEHFTRSGSGAKFMEAALKRNKDKILEIIAKEAKIP